MDRRCFTQWCSGALLGPGLTGWAAALEDYPRTLLVHPDGAPLKATEVGTEEAMVFAYPLKGVPCYLINLGERSAATGPLASPDDGDYSNPPGVGPKGKLVAFVAICTHQLSYPTPAASYLRYAASGSELGGGPGRIVCCAHGSVYDPAHGAAPVSGPSQYPLLPVRLEHDAASDRLFATGAVGRNFFARFFQNFKGELIERHGPGVYRQEVEGDAVTVPLSTYSRLVPAC
ncbi:Rieske 2Fe-2S domain-containing protein [Comamonas flocculans]|uniref:Rieske 2Fe-2S domain-containing protein n=1 Tax=Comamonas flocculans TaxID=2597701 RepID=A0A5B8RR91_9BURK|nr:Rieske 2Fe-2S domain-containing protein [Comamonas flocculans]QEA12061.1 Rieske 2Fe-2S domain-containing protein [Comamonas flocculans]